MTKVSTYDILKHIDQFPNKDVLGSLDTLGSNYDLYVRQGAAEAIDHILGESIDAKVPEYDLYVRQEAATEVGGSIEVKVTSEDIKDELDNPDNTLLSVHIPKTGDELSVIVSTKPDKSLTAEDWVDHAIHELGINPDNVRVITMTNADDYYVMDSREFSSNVSLMPTEYCKTCEDFGTDKCQECASTFDSIVEDNEIDPIEISADEYLQEYVTEQMNAGAIPLFWFYCEQELESSDICYLYMAEDEDVLKAIFYSDLTSVTNMMKALPRIPGTDGLAHIDYTGAELKIEFLPQMNFNSDKLCKDLKGSLSGFSRVKTYDDLVNMASKIMPEEIDSKYKLLFLDVSEQAKDTIDTTIPNTVAITTSIDSEDNVLTVAMRVVDKYLALFPMDYAFIAEQYMEDHPDNVEVHVVMMSDAESNETYIFDRKVDVNEDGIPVTVIFNRSDPDVTLSQTIGEYVENGAIPMFWNVTHNRIVTDPAMDTGNDVLTLYIAKDEDVLRQIFKE